MLGAEHYGHIARRGLIAIRDQQFDDLPPPVQKLHELQMEIPTWGLWAVGATLLCGILMIASVRYTLYHVVATLAMVESPQTTVIVHQEKEKIDPDALVEDIIDSEVLILKQKPITGSIDATIKHLQSRGGVTARWRGFSTAMIWVLGYTFFNNFFADVMSPLDDYHNFRLIKLAPAIASVFSRLLLARIGVSWTHIVISEPSAKPWYRRIPSRQVWKQIAGPTFLTAVAWQFNFLLPAVVATMLNLQDGPSMLDEENAKCSLIKMLAVFGIGFVWFLGICVPAEVALTRVQASLLPDEDESIVPFDRTFSGAVEPKIVGGSGALGYVQAWQTFDRPARLRLLKLFAKIIMIDVLLHVFVAFTVVMELFAIVGPQLQTILASGSVSRPQAQFEWEAQYHALPVSAPGASSY